jgi:hypothetical protein
MPRDPDVRPRCGAINNPGQQRCDSCGASMLERPSWWVAHPRLAGLLTIVLAKQVANAIDSPVDLARCR